MLFDDGPLARKSASRASMIAITSLAVAASITSFFRRLPSRLPTLSFPRLAPSIARPASPALLTYRVVMMPFRGKSERLRGALDFRVFNRYSDIVQH
jgi:hypothetical protein